MSPRRTVDELHDIDETDFVFIIDDNLFANARRAQAIAELIDKENIRKNFLIQAQPETVVRHPDVIESWANIGLWALWLGFESASEAGMRRIGADKSAETTSEAVDILSSMGIKTLGSFIVSPDFTHDDFECLHAKIDELNTVFLNFFVLTPYPGTVMFERVGRKYSIDEYRLFDGFHAVLPTRLPLEEFYKKFAGLFFHFWRKRDTSLLKLASPKEAVFWYKRFSRLHEDHNLKPIDA